LDQNNTYLFVNNLYLLDLHHHRLDNLSTRHSNWIANSTDGHGYRPDCIPSSRFDTLHGGKKPMAT